ncbi:FG-GAP repeat protein [Engelhardtia mirabilis]|uniref:FG-GAP repeat protein n=1 Tax=Engelhardtia mirabilis TaxID=2528011 RepID=A0A518BSC6_9BACT|nr:hypothetical protein Pla133_50020 [Planctomycetes bacterium Pla133]QDV04205.1 hypothetical protein Pla86_50000 [Planctomycetes bacterium Pla86]
MLHLLVLLPLLAPPTPQVGFASETLLSSTTDVGDKFGDSIDVDGDVLVVGARANADLAPTAGQAVVFERQADGSWLEVAVLSPPTPEVVGFFGDEVAVSGVNVFVAERNDDVFGANEGAVYVYERQPDGTWPLIQTLGPADLADSRTFGADLDAWGPRLAVASGGAVDEPSPVSIFLRQPDGTFALEDEVISPTTTTSFGHFPGVVAMEADWLVVGSPNYYETVVGPVGELLDFLPVAHVFRRDPSGSWLPLANLYWPGGAPGNEFGAAVDLELHAGGALVAIGAAHAPPTGRVFLFDVDTSGVVQELDQVEVSTGPCCNSTFGDAVLLTGERLIASDPLFRTGVEVYDTGRIYVFDRTAPDEWSLVQILEDDLAVPDDWRELGTSLALDGSALLAGEPGPGGPASKVTGEVHVFSDIRLFHGLPELSLGAGGSQDLLVAAGPQSAGASYLMLGSASGTQPSIPLPGGLALPLVLDAYTDLTLAGGGGLLSGNFGTLGPLGDAVATFALPAGSDPVLAGLTVHHAYVVIGAASAITAVGGPAPLVLMP